jgi:hypothetical protein
MALVGAVREEAVEQIIFLVVENRTDCEDKDDPEHHTAQRLSQTTGNGGRYDFSNSDILWLI